MSPNKNGIISATEVHKYCVWLFISNIDSGSI